MKSTNFVIVSVLSLFLSALQLNVNAQNVSINDSGALPDTSAMLDVSSTSKGILIPRMTQAQRMAISQPANGLIVFQTDYNEGLYVYVAVAEGWEKLVFIQELLNTPVTLDSVLYNGNDATGQEIINVGKLGINTSAPSEELDVAGRATIDTLNINAAYTFPVVDGAANYYIKTDGSGNLSWDSGDNLGNHSATQTISLNSNKISNDGGNEGISISNTGLVTISPATTGAGNYALLTQGDVQTVGQGTGVYFTNNQIGITGNNGNTGDMRFKAGSTDRLRLTANGNFLFYTPTSGTTMDVAGTSVFDTINVNGQYKFSSVDGLSNQVQYTNGSGTLGWASVKQLYGESTLPDTLGIHLMDTTLVTQEKWISGDGDLEGLFVNNAGKVNLSKGIYHYQYDNLNYIEFLGNNATSIYAGDFVTIGSSENIHFNVDKNTTRLAVTDTGVGIGTIAPHYDLEMASGGVANDAQFVIRNSDASHAVSLSSGHSSANPFLSWQDGDALIFATNATGYSEKIRINSDGKLGIGTSTPVQLIDARGQNTDEGALATLSNSDRSHFLQFFPGRLNDPNPFIQVKQGDPLRFASDEGGFKEFMRIDSNGRIGIDNTSPTAPLSFTNANNFKKLSLYDVNNNNHQFMGFGTDANMLRYQVDAAASSHVFFAGSSTTASTELMRITGTGNVGIGVASPTNKLEVNGDMVVGITKYSSRSTSTGSTTTSVLVKSINVSNAAGDRWMMKLTVSGLSGTEQAISEVIIMKTNLANDVYVHIVSNYSTDPGYLGIPLITFNSTNSTVEIRQTGASLNSGATVYLMSFESTVYSSAAQASFN